MPIHTYVCETCRAKEERLVSISEAESQYCEVCTNKLIKRFPLVAKTAGSWNAGWNAGLSGQGKYDAGLGMVIYNESQRDKELEDRGWVRESDLGSNWFDRTQNKLKEEAEKINDSTNRYAENLKKFDGDKEKAVTETWNAKDCLDGLYD